MPYRPQPHQVYDPRVAYEVRRMRRTNPGTFVGFCFILGGALVLGLGGLSALGYLLRGFSL